MTEPTTDDSAATVVFASREAPTLDPCAYAMPAFAVNTLPLSNIEECRRKLQELRPGRLLILAAPGSRPDITRVLATVSEGKLDAAVVDAPIGHLAARVFVGRVDSALRRSGLDAALLTAHALRHHLVSQVLVASVNKVDRPAPTLVQTARGLLPGARFAICTGALDQVQSPPQAVGLPGVQAMARTSSGTELPRWMTAVVAELTDPDVPELPSWRGFAQFGHRHWSEVVWGRTEEMQALAHRVGSTQLASCAWCSCPVVDTACDFCGHVVSSGVPDTGSLSGGSTDRRKEPLGR